MFEPGKKVSPIILEDAHIRFRNFRGEVTKTNKNGYRKFTVDIPDDLAPVLLEDGWNVKFLPPRENDPDGYSQPILDVKVNFACRFPPTVIMITPRGKMRLDEETIGQLDRTRILQADVHINPRYYDEAPNRPNGGISAYLRELYVTVEEERLESKYANIPYINGPADLPFEQ